MEATQKINFHFLQSKRKCWWLSAPAPSTFQVLFHLLTLYNVGSPQNETADSTNSAYLQDFHYQADKTILTHRG